MSAQTNGRSDARTQALMLIATFCWAANIIAGKVVLRSASPLALAQFRVTAGAVVFGALFFGWGGRRALRFGRAEWGWLALTAISGITLNQLFFIAGIGRTSAAHAGLIVALGPVMVLGLACLMRLEPLTLMKAIGTAVALGGVGILTAGKSSSSSGASLAGDAIMFVGTGVFAYYTILLKQIAARHDALTLNAIIFALGALFMLPFSAWAAVSVRWTALPARASWCLAFMVLLGTVMAYLIYALALKELTAARVAAFAYLQPVIAIALGVWLLAERLTLSVVLGGGLILLGVCLAEREAEREKAES
jgi:drug/metabolite transporter (DMT)-like permease